MDCLYKGVGSRETAAASAQQSRWQNHRESVLEKGKSNTEVKEKSTRNNSANAKFIERLQEVLQVLEQRFPCSP